MPVISCDTNPTFSMLAGVDKAVNKARITKIFPRLVTRENAKCETQKEKKTVLW